MAGRGMGIATQGGGAVSSGPRNKKLSAPSKKITVMMKEGGEAVKKRGGRTAADSKGKGHAASYQKSFKKRQAIRARALIKAEAKKRKSSGNSDLISQHKRLAMGEKVTGYQYGGGIGSAIGRQAAAVGPAANRQAAQSMARNQAVLRARAAANPRPKPPMPSAAAQAGATRLRPTPRPAGMKKGGKAKKRKGG